MDETCNDCGITKEDVQYSGEETRFYECYYCHETFCEYCLGEFVSRRPLCTNCEYSFDPLSS